MDLTPSTRPWMPKEQGSRLGSPRRSPAQTTGLLCIVQRELDTQKPDPQKSVSEITGAQGRKCRGQPFPPQQARCQSLPAIPLDEGNVAIQLCVHTPHMQKIIFKSCLHQLQPGLNILEVTTLNSVILQKNKTRKSNFLPLCHWQSTQFTQTFVKVAAGSHVLPRQHVHLKAMQLLPLSKSLKCYCTNFQPRCWVTEHHCV